jgi:hypothetical protein
MKGTLIAMVVFFAIEAGAKVAHIADDKYPRTTTHTRGEDYFGFLLLGGMAAWLLFLLVG